MKKIFLSLVLFVITVFSYAQQGEKNFIDQPYIEVTGTAELDIVPDMIDKVFFTLLGIREHSDNN